MTEKVKAPIMKKTIYEVCEKYDISYEKAKKLANKWAEGYRKGIAETAGVKPREVNIERQWKEDWFKDWIESFLGHSPGLAEIMNAYARAAGESYGRTRARQKIGEVV